ncbi:hypothetical protein [Nocardia acidivorans]|uniref:hypothetical protein n=1 Tax=Nocardia acidivorans TaxID=404580 RepID=UPI00083035E5|nr:hypothetical protein [Nocardia acidivorans]
MTDTVEEIVNVTAAEGIDADVVKSGQLTVARNSAQQERLGDTLAHAPRCARAHRPRFGLRAAATAHAVPGTSPGLRFGAPGFAHNLRGY